MNRSTACVLIALIAAGLCAPPGSAVAAIPQEMHYQGRLTDDLGDPLQGSHTLTFRIFDVEFEGTELWSETETASLDANGVFAAVLGDGTPLDLPFDVAYWLEVEVDGETISDRRDILTSAYAFRAEDADHLGGLAASNYVVEGEINAVTEPMVAPDIVSSINDVSNDCGNINLVAGPNITIAPNDLNNEITISADGGPSGVTAVHADGGLYGSDTTGEVHLSVNTGTGLEISGDDVALTLPYITGTAYDLRFVDEGQLNSVTTDMVVPDIVSSVDGVSNDGGDIDLVAGENITITPGFNSIMIASPGGTGDITAVYADDGLSETALSGDAHLSVNTGAGLQISSDAVGLTVPYSSGSAYDSRFVNELQSNSITSAMIGSGQVGQSDVSNGYLDLSSSQTIGGSKTFSSSVDVNATCYADKFYVSDAGNGNAVSVRNNSSSYPPIWAENESTSGSSAIFGRNTSSSGHAIYGLNQHSGGTGLMGVGNGTGGYYLTGGSGIAATGSGTGLYVRANESGNDGQEAILAALGTGDYSRLCYRSTGGSQYKVIGDGAASTVMETSRGPVSLIAVESPEAWFEDYGSATLVDGFCHVDLESVFLECVTVDETNPIRVFVELTEPLKGSYYIRKDIEGFDVIAPDADPGTVSFDYRVVAKWKGWEGVRFDRVDGVEQEIEASPVMLSESESLMEAQTETDKQ